VIKEELKRMAQKKFLSRTQLELLLKLPDERLSLVCSTLMVDIFQLSEKEIKSLIYAKDIKRFKKTLKEIKKKMAEQDITGIEKALLYQLAKFFGQVEFRKKNRDFVKESIAFLVSRILIPSLKMIRVYEKDGIIESAELGPLREFFRALD